MHAGLRIVDPELVIENLSAAIGKTGAANRAEAVTIAEGNGRL